MLARRARTILPGVGPALTAPRERTIVVRDEGGHAIAIDVTDDERLRIASMDPMTGARTLRLELDESMRFVGPHVALAERALLFVTDARVLYALEIEDARLRFRVSIRADRVLALVAIDGEVFLPMSVDTASDYRSSLARIDAVSGALETTLECEGELRAIERRGDGLVMRTEAADGARPFGRRIELALTPALVTTSRVERRLLDARGVGRADVLPKPVRLPREEMRPPPRLYDASRCLPWAEPMAALRAVEGMVLTPLVERLVQRYYGDPLFRWRFERLGLILRTPAATWSAHPERDPSLLDFAEHASGRYVCVDARTGAVFELDRDARSATWRANDLDAFLTAYLDDAARVAPTATDLVRAALGLSV